MKNILSSIICFSNKEKRSIMYPDKKKVIERLMEHYNKQPEHVLLNVIENLLGDYTTEELKNLLEGEGADE